MLLSLFLLLGGRYVSLYLSPFIYFNFFVSPFVSVCCCLRSTVVQQVLRLDLPSSRLAAALSSCPPMRGQLLSEQQLRVAARLCSSSSSSSSSTQLETEDSDLPVPQAVILDVGHNESALERLFQVYFLIAVAAAAAAAVAAAAATAAARGALEQ